MNISVIVPVYNTEKLLDRSIQSILNQSFTDFELLLVDDGSSDNSGAVCDAYASKDPRVKVIHQANSGVSVARNKAIELSSGKYLAFIDSDDMVQPNYLSKLYEESEEHGMVCQGIIFKRLNGKKDIVIGDFDDRNVSTVDFFKEHRVTKLGYLFPKLYKRSIINEHNIRFDESVLSVGDSLFNLEYLKYVDSLFLSSVKGYIYIELANSLVKKKYNYDKEYELLEKADRALKEVMTVHKLPIDSSIKYKELEYYLFRVLNSIIVMSDAEERRIKLTRLMKLYKNELLEIYSKAKGRGRIAYRIIKKNRVNLFEFYLKKFVFK